MKSLAASSLQLLLLLGVMAPSVCAAADEPTSPPIPRVPEYEPGVLIVGVESGALTDVSLEAALANSGFSLIDRLPSIGAIVIRIPRSAGDPKALAATLQQQSTVGALKIRYAEPNYRWYPLRVPNDPLYSSQTVLKRIGAETAWDRTIGDSAAIVAVIDTGTDHGHPDLAAQVWVNPGEVAANGVDDDRNGIVDDVHGARFRNGAGSGNPMDDQSHGTHVAGTIAAVTNNQVGVAGVAWDARLMAIKFLDANGGYTRDAVLSLAYAVRHGARVVNCSWGGGAYSYALRDAIAHAGAAGAVVVAAAGNSAQDTDQSPMYPASYDVPNIVAVQATTSFDYLAGFSNYGARSVDLAAPGVSIRSTVPGGYSGMSGTSMAAPHVSGALVLTRSLAPSWSVAQAKAWLLESALPLAHLQGKSVSGARLDLDRLTSAPVVLTAPASGQSWSVGETSSVMWQQRFPSSACTSGALELSYDDGSTFPESLATNVAWSQQSTTITVPARASLAARVRARCDASNLVAVSEAFTIQKPLRIISPDAGAKWRALRSATLEWEGTPDQGGHPACTTVDIRLSTDGGASFARVLAKGTVNDGTHRLRVPLVRATRDAVISLECTAIDQSAVSDRFPIRNRLGWLALLLLALLAAG